MAGSEARATLAFLAVVRYLSMPPHPPNWDITTEAEFESALQSLLLSALNNGLDLRGAWEYRTDQINPHLEVLVTELAEST